MPTNAKEVLNIILLEVWGTPPSSSCRGLGAPQTLVGAECRDVAFFTQFEAKKSIVTPK